MTDRDVPAGWYDDGHGFQRWFDGTAWTETVVKTDPARVRSRTAAAVTPLTATPPAPPASPPPPPPPYTGPSTTEPVDAPKSAPAATEPSQPGRSPRRRRGWAVAAGVVVLAAAAGGTYAAMAAADPSPVAAPPPTPRAAVTTAPSLAPTVAPTPVATTTGSPGPSATASTNGRAAAAAPTETAALQSAGDWTAASYQLTEDASGQFGGTARIRYDGADPAGGQAIFTLTVTRNGTEVATLIGTVLGADPGQTKTVRLTSSDPYVRGPYSSVTFERDS